MPNSGFTLLELITVIALIAVITCFGLPNVGRILHRQQILSEMELLERSLIQARLAALTSGNVVIVCGSQDGRHCNDHWSKGYLGMRLVMASDAKSIQRGSKNNEILFFHTLDGRLGDLQYHGFPKSSVLAFYPNDRLGYSNGTITFVPCDQTLFQKIDLVINSQERIRKVIQT